MNRSFVYRNFKAWLKTNRQRFRFYPYITNVKKNSFEVQFQGLGKILFLNVKSGGEFSVWTNLVSRKLNYPWDWCADFDLLEQKTSRGYSCGFCEEENKKYYIHRENMYIEHCYEPFLKWCNENLKEGHLIVNMGRINHGGFSRICSISDLEAIDRNELIDIFEIKFVKS